MRTSPGQGAAAVLPGPPRGRFPDKSVAVPAMVRDTEEGSVIGAALVLTRDSHQVISHQTDALSHFARKRSDIFAILPALGACPYP